MNFTDRTKTSATLMRWCLMLAAACLLAACGFHLRGAADLPFKTIYLGSPLTSPLLVELKRNLQANGARVVDDPQDADVMLNILATTVEQKVLTLNTNGRVREYGLYQHFVFSVTDRDKVEVLKPTDILLRRTITYDPNQELAKQAETVLLYKDMQSDTVQQILRRLAGMKNAQIEGQDRPAAGNDAGSGVGNSSSGAAVPATRN